MPIMRKSAWAKLTMFITPQIIVRPTAIREYMQPMSRPFMSCASSCSDIVGPSRNVGGGGSRLRLPSPAKRYFRVFQAGNGQITSAAADSNGHTVT